MDLYKLNKRKLKELKNIPFKLEKDIQNVEMDLLHLSGQ